MYLLRLSSACSRLAIVLEMALESRFNWPIRLSESSCADEVNTYTTQNRKDLFLRGRHHAHIHGNPSIASSLPHILDLRQAIVGQCSTPFGLLRHHWLRTRACIGNYKVAGLVR